MNILDSSAIIEMLRDGDNAGSFKDVFLKLDDVLLPSIILTEVRRFYLRELGREQADLVTRSLLRCREIPIDHRIAELAADVSREHRLPIADALIYASAITHGATLWTQDNHFEHLPHVQYFQKVY